MITHPFTYVCDWNSVPVKDWPLYFDRFAAAGAKHLVLTETMIENIFLNPSFRDDLRQWMANSGLSFADGHSQFQPGSTLVAPDSCRSMVVARQLFNLEIMADFGVTAGCFHIGKNYEYPDLTIDAARANVRKTLEKLLPEAERLGVVICIENIFHVLNNVDHLLELIAEFDHPFLGVCYDSGHANIMENGKGNPDSVMYARWGAAGVAADDIPWETNTLERLLPHIVMCHLHDNNGLGDQHKLPFEGTLDMLPIVRTLETSAPRLQVIQSEVLPFRNNYSIRELCGYWSDLCAQV